MEERKCTQSPETASHKYTQVIFNKEAKVIQWSKNNLNKQNTWKISVSFTFNLLKPKTALKLKSKNYPKFPYMKDIISRIKRSNIKSNR